MPKVQLPATLHHGRVLRVASVNCIEVNLHLKFGISVQKNIVLEGVESHTIPPQSRQQAQHCLIVLLGGKDVIVHIDDDKRDGYLIGRVYLNEKVHGNPEGMNTPFGLDSPMLEVSGFYRWLATKNYDVAVVKSVLNGG